MSQTTVNIAAINGPMTGMSYYRLTQTDFDGQSTTFKTVAVYNSERGKLDMFPNPSPDYVVTLSFTQSDLDSYEVFVQDITGKIVPSHTVASERFGEMKLILDGSRSARSGIYIVTVRTPTETYKERLLINSR